MNIIGQAIRVSFCCLFILTTSLVEARILAPVVDRTTDAATSIATAHNENIENPRLYRLEQQMNNLLGQNFAAKIEELQHLIQQMNGELEAKTHQIEQLEKKIKDFYQDVNQRIENKKIDGVSNADSATIKAKEPLKVSATQPITSAASTKEDVFFKEQQMYQMAIDLLPDKKRESEIKLREYLKQYPRGVYVANAHYWLGEINFSQKNFDVAEEEFNAVIKKHAKSKRIADALLKIALVHQNQGRETQAKQELQKLVKTHPNAPAAQLAKQQLALLKK